MDAIGIFQTITERATEEFDGVAAGIAEAVLSAWQFFGLPLRR